ncbi:MAG: murein L,D-transpeptidase family protein [Limisphaerales bacterium]
MKPRLIIYAGIAVVLLAAYASRALTRKTVEERVKEFGPVARARLEPHFKKAAVAYPPAKLTLVGIKDERRIELFAAGPDGKLKLVRDYRVLGASGELGPKLREGDQQVPEGVYPIESLKPNSRFHLSLRVGYPNAFDRAKAKLDGRAQLGGDIMIHGSNVSIGCLATGDEAAEDLFVLAADTGLKNITVILTPVDFRFGKSVPKDTRLPVWAAELYAQIKSRLAVVPTP